MADANSVAEKSKVVEDKQAALAAAEEAYAKARDEHSDAVAAHAAERSASFDQDVVAKARHLGINPDNFAAEETLKEAVDTRSAEFPDEAKAFDDAQNAGSEEATATDNQPDEVDAAPSPAPVTPETPTEPAAPAASQVPTEAQIDPNAQPRSTSTAS